jgi:hypothetical protein
VSAGIHRYTVPGLIAGAIGKGCRRLPSRPDSNASTHRRFLRKAARQCGCLRTNVKGNTASAHLAWARHPTAHARSGAVAMVALPDRCTHHGQPCS